jgi:regulator of replication initiation timing
MSCNKTALQLRAKVLYDKNYMNDENKVLEDMLFEVAMSVREITAENMRLRKENDMLRDSVIDNVDRLNAAESCVASQAAEIGQWSNKCAELTEELVHISAVSSGQYKITPLKNIVGFGNAKTPCSNASARSSSVASTVPLSPMSTHNDDFMPSNTEFVPAAYDADSEDNDVVEGTEFDDKYSARRPLRRRLSNDY